MLRSWGSEAGSVHGGPALCLVHRAAGGEPASGMGPCKIEDTPSPLFAGVFRLSIMLFHKGRPKYLRIGMPGLLGYMLRKAHLHNLSQVHHSHLVTHQFHHPQVMRYEKIRTGPVVPFEGRHYPLVLHRGNNFLAAPIPKCGFE